MRLLRQAGAVLAMLLVASSVASAQGRAKPLEFGTDASLSLGLDDQGTRLQIPVGSFRVGFHTSDVLSIEPFGTISYFKPDEGDGATVYNVGLGGLYHFSTNRAQPQLYVRPFLALVGFSGGGASDSEFGIGVGAGYKFAPMMGGRLQWRGEANIFSINDATSINFLWGISLYPR